MGILLLGYRRGQYIKVYQKITSAVLFMCYAFKTSRVLGRGNDELEIKGSGFQEHNHYV